MSLVVSYALKGHVGVITVDNAPVNALLHAVRAGIAAALTAAATDDSGKVAM